VKPCAVVRGGRKVGNPKSRKQKKTNRNKNKAPRCAEEDGMGRVFKSKKRPTKTKKRKTGPIRAGRSKRGEASRRVYWNTSKKERARPFKLGKTRAWNRFSAHWHGEGV